MAARFTREPAYMYIQLDESLDLPVAKAVFLALIEHPEFEIGMHVLWDAREVWRVDLGHEDLKRFGRFVAEHEARRGGGRSALVASHDAVFGTFRVHELLNHDKVSYEFRVFRDFEAAREWLLAAGNL